MGIIDPPIPSPGTGSVPAQAQIDALDDIVTEINGALDNDNLAARSIGPGKWPGNRWRTYTATPGFSFTAPPPIPEFPNFSTAAQSVKLATYPFFDGSALREISFSFLMSKVGTIIGGNNNPNLSLNMGLRVTGQTGGGWFSSNLATATIPGSDGVRRRYRVGLVDDKTVSPVFGTLVLRPPSDPVVLDAFEALGSFDLYADFQASGSNSPLNNFVIHHVSYSYRDWEF